MIENKDIIQEVFEVLSDNGIDIERVSHLMNGEWVESNEPDIRTGWYNGVDGFYFNKSDYGNFNKEQVESLFPMNIQGKQIELVDVSYTDYDDDRIWKASIAFIIK